MLPRAFLLPARRQAVRVKLALHRSIIFWSGLLMIAFLCWSWTESRKSFRWIKDRHFHACQLAGGILLTWDRIEGAPREVSRIEESFKISMRQTPKGEAEIVLGPGMGALFEAPMMARNARDSTFFIPHWLLLIAVALPWSALLFGRGRRRRRFALAAAEAAT